VVGASIAFHFAEKDINTLILDQEGPAGSSARSGTLIRALSHSTGGRPSLEEPHRILRALG
jgi:glycine/D-amino acid oxidase-like deaminating enzyme